MDQQQTWYVAFKGSHTTAICIGISSPRHRGSVTTSLYSFHLSGIFASLSRGVVYLHPTRQTAAVGVDKTGPLRLSVVTSAGVHDVVEVLDNISRLDIDVLGVL